MSEKINLRCVEASSTCLFILSVVLLLCCFVFIQSADAIVGGGDAEEGEFPWHVIFDDNGMNRCSGSLISREWVLTSALCVQDGDDWKVIAGRDEVGGSEHEQESLIDIIILHENFDSNSGFLSANIALVRLSSPVEMTPYVSPIALSRGTPSRNTELTLSGWGLTQIFDDSGNIDIETATVLQKANMKVAGSCPSYPFEYDDVFCTDYRLGTAGCRDYGSGLTDLRHGAFLVGVVSATSALCDEETYLVDVATYLDWIAMMTQTTLSSGQLYSKTACVSLQDNRPVANDPENVDIFVYRRENGEDIPVYRSDGMRGLRFPGSGSDSGYGCTSFQAPTGRYYLYIKTDDTLMVEKPIYVTSRNNFLHLRDSLTMLEGDANSDNKISGADTSIFDSEFNKNNPICDTNDYEARADFDEDDCVTQEDKDLLMENFTIFGTVKGVPLP